MRSSLGHGLGRQDGSLAMSNHLEKLPRGWLWSLLGWTQHARPSSSKATYKNRRACTFLIWQIWQTLQANHS